MTSPRRGESPLQRRQREAASSSCLEVQWRFLQRSNPTPPQFRSSPTSTNAAGLVHGCSSPNQQIPTMRSPSKLFQLFQTTESEVEPPPTTSPVSTPDCEATSPTACRVLNDLMGETQRQAMLDRILAEMEDLAVEPVYPRLGQSTVPRADQVASPRQARIRKASVLQTAFSSDSGMSASVSLLPQRKYSSLGAISGRHGQLDEEDDEDEESTSGQRSKHQTLREDIQTPHIFWQQSAGVRFAQDMPPRLQSRAPAKQLKRAPTIVMGRRSHAPGGPSKLSGEERRRLAAYISEAAAPEPSSVSTDTVPQVEAVPEAKCISVTPRRRVRALAASEAPESPPKLQYGAWYVPQSEWWTLRQLEAQTAAPQLPAVNSDPHCHHSGGRQHKPGLPSAAFAPGARERGGASAADSSSSGAGRRGSSSSRSGAVTSPASNASPLEVQAIPETYIGREYRAYLLNTGSVLPQYLR